ncbi:MAG: AfsR/SARP family transcriptional regulator, partial [Acidobacteriaceae bacterium]
LEDHFLLLNVELSEAALARREGKFARASTYLRSADELIHRSQSNLEKSLWSMEAGNLALAEKKYQVATQHLSNALALFEESGQKLETASAALVLSKAYALSKKDLEARNMMKQALNIIQHLESNQPLIVLGRSVKEELKGYEGDVHLGAPAVRLLSQIENFERHITALRRRLRPHAATVLLIPPRLSIFVLGNSQVKLDGKPVTSPTWVNQKKARELFFFLLARPNKSMTREEIGVILWPESSTEQLRLQFRNTIYYLRYALGQDVIINVERRYAFNVDLDYSYDVLEFEHSLEQAQSADTSERKIELLKESLCTYQGEYFPEGEGAWVMAERQRLSQMHEHCLITLALLQLEGGEPKMALVYCQTILAENHCMEAAHRLAMQALSALGDRSGVVNQYEQCKQYLLEELGLEPSPETIKLYKMVR